jgi:hypothetical protein
MRSVRTRRGTESALVTLAVDCDTIAPWAGKSSSWARLSPLWDSSRVAMTEPVRSQSGPAEVLRRLGCRQDTSGALQGLRGRRRHRHQPDHRLYRRRQADNVRPVPRISWRHDRRGRSSGPPRVPRCPFGLHAGRLAGSVTAAIRMHQNLTSPPVIETGADPCSLAWSLSRCTQLDSSWRTPCSYACGSRGYQPSRP